MVRIYATSVERGEKNFFDVPESLQSEVRKLIEAEGYIISSNGVAYR